MIPYLIIVPNLANILLYIYMRLATLRAHHVWAAGGTRAQGRRSTGDVLGGCLQKNLEAFAKAKDEENGLHSELLLPRMDEIG